MQVTCTLEMDKLGNTRSVVFGGKDTVARSETIAREAAARMQKKLLHESNGQRTFVVVLVLKDLLREAQMQPYIREGDY